MCEKENIIKDISITKIKFDDETTDENVKEKVAEYIQDAITKKDKKSKSISCHPPDEVTAQEKTFFILNVDVKKEVIRSGTPDCNRGQICFVYWRSEDNVTNIYCLVNAGYSDSWKSLKLIRDCSFPKKFAKTFLDSRAVRSADVVYLTGINKKSSLFKFDLGKFQSAEITDDYGIVNSFTTLIKKDASHCVELRKMLNDANQPIKKQIGQIKLPLKISDDKKIIAKNHIEMLLLVHKSITNKKLNNPVDQDWRFIEYIQPIFDRKKTDKLNKSLLQEVYDCLFKDDGEDRDHSYGISSSLSYEYQDSFDESSVLLLYKDRKIRKYLKGKDITMKEICNLEDIKTNIREPNDLKNIKLEFYDFVKEEEVTKQCVKMLQCYNNDDELTRAFQFRGTWYEVELDSCFDITFQFIECVKKCLLPKKEKEANQKISEIPEILQWHNKKTDINKKTNAKKTGEPINFSISELYEFCKIPFTSSQQRQEQIGNLKSILTKDRQMIKLQSQDEQGVRYENNLVGMKSHITKKIQENNQPTHTWEFLSLNTCILGRKRSETNDNGENKATANSMNVELSTEDWIHIPANDKKKEKFEKWCESLPTIQNNKGTNGYYVNRPYLTIDTWKEIENDRIDICPSKLVQYLRMHYTDSLNEGDYNELYHLSNCDCLRSNFDYVVADRVFGPENHNIELFDVMAINKDTKVAYLLHVKHKFGATAAREMCSQVCVSGYHIWNSLSTYSSHSRNMLQKFYTAATKERKESEIHELLSKLEMEKIGKSEEDFLQFMICEIKTFYICAAPCTNKFRFVDVLETNLQYQFKKEDFPKKIPDVINALKNANIIDRYKHTVNPVIFYPKIDIKKKLVQFLEEKHADEIYKTIFKKIGGVEKTQTFLTPNSSLIAKIMLIDLNKKFQNPQSAQVKLGIIEIPELMKKSLEPKSTQYTILDCFNKQERKRRIATDIGTPIAKKEKTDD